jgi:hypothetical protein
MLLLFLGSLPLAADEGQWYTRETQYLRIHYQLRDLSSAQALAEYGDTVYQQMVQWWDRDPGTVPVILQGETAIPNGFMAYAPRRLVLHLASPSDILLSARGAGWLRDLFVHELAHFFHLTTPVGWIGGLSRVFGQSVMLGPRATMPTWASEGVAVYLETQFSQGGRGRNPWFTLPLKALNHHDYQPYPSISLGETSSRVPGFGNRSYWMGYLWVDYLERSAPGTFKAIDDFHKQWPFFGWNYAVHAITGKTEQRIWEEALEDWPEWQVNLPEQADPPGAENIIQDEDWLSLPVAQSQSLWTYQSSAQKTRGLYRDKQLVLPVSLARANQFDVREDGQAQVWVSYLPDPTSSFSLAYDTGLYLAEQGRWRRLFPGRRFWHPQFDPQGLSLLVTEERGDTHRLLRVGLDGDEEVLFEREGYRVMYPRIDASGNKILFTLQGGGSQELYLLKRGVFTRIFTQDSPIVKAEWLEEGGLALLMQLGPKDAGLQGFRSGSIGAYRLDLEELALTHRLSLPEVGITDLKEIKGEVLAQSLGPRGPIYTKEFWHPIEGSLPIRHETYSPSPVGNSPGTREPNKDEPFLDWPILHLWGPVADWDFINGYGSYGLGAYWANYGESHQGSLSLMKDTGSGYLLDAQLSQRLGPLRIGSVSSLYTDLGSWRLNESLDVGYPLLWQSYPQRATLSLLGGAGLLIGEDQGSFALWNAYLGLGGRLGESSRSDWSFFGGSQVGLDALVGTESLGFRPGVYASLQGTWRYWGPLRVTTVHRLGVASKPVGSSFERWPWFGSLNFRSGRQRTLSSAPWWGFSNLDLQFPLYQGDFRLWSFHLRSLGIGVYGESQWETDFQDSLLGPAFDLGAYLAGEYFFLGLTLEYTLGLAWTFSRSDFQVLGNPAPFFQVGWNPGGSGVRWLSPGRRELGHQF